MPPQADEKFWHSEFQIVAASTQQLTRLRIRKHGATVYNSLEECAGDVDAVWITCSTDFHKAVILACARLGKPMFCEKPIAVSEDDIRACYEATEAAQVPLLCGWNRR